MTKQPNLKTIGWIKMKDDFLNSFIPVNLKTENQESTRKVCLTNLPKLTQEVIKNKNTLQIGV